MEKKCLECGKLFEISKFNNYKNNRTSHSFCSKKCLDKAFHRDYDIKSKVKKLNLVRSKDRYKNRNKLKICEKCGSNNKVQIHHITYDLDINIIKFLCVECHKKLHGEILR